MNKVRFYRFRHSLPGLFSGDNSTTTPDRRPGRKNLVQIKYFEWYIDYSKHESLGLDISVLSLFYFYVFQIYTEFDEIRQEIEAETERVSGSNKVYYLAT